MAIYDFGHVAKVSLWSIAVFEGWLRGLLACIFFQTNSVAITLGFKTYMILQLRKIFYLYDSAVLIIIYAFNMKSKILYDPSVYDVTSTFNLDQMMF